MQNSPPRANRIATWLGVALALGYFALCVLWTERVPLSWNDMARVAAIESLVERGTWAIDDSRWVELTQDKVQFDGRFYSDKMPLLAWAGAGAYAVLHDRLAQSLAPDCEGAAGGCAYYGLTLGLIGIPAALLVWLMFEHVRRSCESIMIATATTIAVGLGTMVLPYSMVLNHHLPAAVSLFAAFFLVTRGGWASGNAIAAVGFFTTLAVMLDPLAGIFAAALLAMAVMRYRALFLALGALPPLLVTAWLDYQMIGTIIPPYLIPSGYDYPGSVFPATVGGNGTPDDLPQYAFKMFLGAQGLFAYNPILLFALAGMVVAALAKGNARRLDAIVIGIAVLVLGVYLATRTGNLGGEAYGERWYVHVIPIVMSFVIFAPPLAQVFGNAVVRWASVPLFGAVLVVSIYSSYQGAQRPWRYVPPPFHVTRNAETGALGWRSNVRFP